MSRLPEGHAFRWSLIATVALLFPGCTSSAMSTTDVVELAPVQAVAVDTTDDRVLPLDPDLRAAVDSARTIVASLRDSLEFPGISVAVASSDGLLWSEGFGQADVERDLPVTRSTVFPVYSVSKGLTGTALLRLAQDGRIDLDADVQRYLPWFPPKRYPVTIRALAAHLAGIRHYRPGAGEGTDLLHCDSEREAVTRFAADSLLHPPGTAFRYTSFGFVLLSAAMAGSAGESFETVMHETVSRPYALTSLTMRPEEIPLRQRASLYEYREPAGVVPARRMDLSCKLGAGAFYATAEDIASIAAAMAAGRGLTPASHQLVLTPQTNLAGDTVPASIGWDALRDSEGGRWLRRTGGNEDAWSAVMASVEGDVAVALLANMKGRDWIHDEAAAIARLFVAARSGAFPGPGAPDAGASDVREEADATGEEADQAHGETATRDETTIALVGASILPMDRDTLLSNQVVVISDGKIREVADADDAVIPRDAQRFDLQGLYLMPGLVDSHTHAGDPFLPLYLTAGVTTVRLMHGFPERLERRELQRAEPLPWPTILTAGPLVAGEDVPWPAEIAETPDEARAIVAEQAAAGYDFVKVYDGLSRPSYDALVDEANRVGIPFAGHVPMEVGLERVLESGQRTVEHAEQLLYAAFGRAGVMTVPIARTDTIVGLFRRHGGGTCVTPTLRGMTLAMRRGTAFTDSLFAELDWNLVDPEVREWWRSYQAPASEDARPRRDHFLRLQMELAQRLHEAGVPLLAGTDSPYPLLLPGRSLIEEIETLAEAGLSPFEALATATSNAGRCLLTGDPEFGIVRAGVRADLLLLDADPRDDLTTLHRPLGVMVRGRVYEADYFADLKNQVRGALEDAVGAGS